MNEVTRETQERPRWVGTHDRIVAFGIEQAGRDHEVGTLLLDAEREKVPRHVGYGGMGEYAENTLGYEPHHTRERLRVARALRDLPLLRDALRAGQLCWSTVRELTRVATSEHEKAWLDVAAREPVRKVQGMVSGLELGARPGDAREARIERHKLRFVVSGDTQALLSEAMDLVRRETGGDLEPDAVLREMARRILRGPKDDGRASYQIAVSVCERCKQGAFEGGGQRIAAQAPLIEMALCDAQRVVIPSCPPKPPNQAGDADTATAAASEPCATTIQGDATAKPSSATPADTHFGPTWDARAPKHDTRGRLGVASLRRQRTVGPPDLRPGPLGAPPTKDSQSSGRPEHDNPARLRREAPRENTNLPASTERAPAAQDVPPAIRREVLRRDRHTCVVPGCRNHIWVDVHHLDPRNEGGSHDPDRLATLCGAHHDAVHHGRIFIDGSVSTGLCFRHADGSPYGARSYSPATAATYEAVFNALRHSGFRETQAKKLLDQARSLVGHDASPAILLRQALLCS